MRISVQRCSASTDSASCASGDVVTVRPRLAVAMAHSVVCVPVCVRVLLAGRVLVHIQERSPDVSYVCVCISVAHVRIPRAPWVSKCVVSVW